MDRKSARTPPPDAPEIGVDEWVSRADERRADASALRRLERRVTAHVPVGLVFGIAILAGACMPFVVGSDYAVRVGVNTLVFAILALGLNVEVGWVGALDLGYVALFGIGAYLYAFLASDQFHEHWPSLVSIPIVVLATAAVGVAVGLSGRRLVGDYYAIVTLFFAQAFITMVTNADRITPPFANGPINVTGGPNGILNVDPLQIFGLRLDTVRDQFYLALVGFSVIAVAMYLLDHSRTGRSWRAMKDDLLAAELMGMPTHRLRLTALAFGGGIAAFAGVIFATVQSGVFPANFDLSLLITIYAMVIFGGAGNMAGVIAGVVTLNVTLEFLRDPDQARLLFYVVILCAVVLLVRPWWMALTVLAATFSVGMIVREAAEHLIGDRLSPVPVDSGNVVSTIDRWVVVLDSHVAAGNVAYVILLAAAVALTRVSRRWRLVLFPPTLYVAAFVWENRLADNPGVTRLLLLGMILVAFMNVRPRGLLGSTQVEIV